MAAYAIPSDKPFVGKHTLIRRHLVPEEQNAQQALQEFLKTHTVQLVGYEEDGTPIVEVVERQNSG